MSHDNREAGHLVSLNGMLTDKEHYIHKILIPKIQRDYAQGRDGEESVRSRFLDSLFEVIDAKDDSGIMLDFVFGQKTTGNEPVFYPVDGQQRLTTLFLLHLYIGKRAGEDTEFLRKFSYETRESSKQFCQRLHSIKPEDFAGIRDYIVSQWWFTGLWRTDPTIKAMINMLDAIDTHYAQKGYTADDFRRIWPRLRDKVTFWRLHLSDLNTTDELYIKMNSRGKKLTDFEHFKAMLDEYAGTGGELSAKIDTIWTNLLWRYHDDSRDCDLLTDDYTDNGLDTCFHNLLLFYLNVEGCKRGTIDFQSPEKDLMKLASAVLGFTPPREELPEEELRKMRAGKTKQAREIMRRFEDIMDFFSEQDAAGNYIHDPKAFFGEFIQRGYSLWSEDASLNGFTDQPQKVFIGERKDTDLLKEVCKDGLLKLKPTIYMEAFFQLAISRIDKTKFLDRFRILRNLVENTEIHARDFRTTLLVVDELIEKGNMGLPGITDELNKMQKDQEELKNAWIAANPAHENLLKAVENHWLLFGNLNTLVEGEEPDRQINLTALERFGRLFNSECDYMLIERAMLTVGDYAPAVKARGVKAYGGADWRRWKELTQSFGRIVPGVIQKFLADYSDYSLKALEEIIKKASNPEVYPWTYYLRTYPTIYSATRSKYRYLDGEYSYFQLNANGGGGSEFFWNPYNLAVESLLKKNGIECETNCAGGSLYLNDATITVDIKEKSIEISLPDGTKTEHSIPQDSDGHDTIDRIKLAFNLCTDTIVSMTN